MRSEIHPLTTALALLCCTSLTQANDLGRLQALLAATPEGGWVKVSTGNLGSAFPTGLDAVPNGFGSPAGVVRAWSSSAWDSANGQLLLWGGGHANYGGNEMYRWDAASGIWSLGSLPSRLDVSQPNLLPVIGNGAPQSAHTYDGNVFLSVNRMFATFGGAGFPTGGALQSASGPTGPWLWDPAKADANKVGGGDGTGWDASREGGNMWTNRYDSAVGSLPTQWIHVAAAQRVENGKDVVYLTADGYLSGFPRLFRYEVGDVANGGSDRWEVVGRMVTNAATGFAYQGVSFIDSVNNLFVRSGSLDPNLFDNIPSTEQVFLVWDLDTTNAENPTMARAVRLVNEDGTPFLLDRSNSGIDFDSASGRATIWSGKEDGLVYTTEARYDGNGNLLDSWVVKAHASATSAQPMLDTLTGVLGKWDYVAELGAFIAIEEWSGQNQDAAVWLYKPLTAVPEPSSPLLIVAGLAGLGLVLRRRRT